MVDAIIKGCLFHWKKCLNTKFKAVVGYVDNELLRNDLFRVSASFCSCGQCPSWLEPPEAASDAVSCCCTFHRLLPEGLAIQPELSNFDVELL